MLQKRINNRSWRRLDFCFVLHGQMTPRSSSLLRKLSGIQKLLWFRSRGKFPYFGMIFDVCFVLTNSTYSRFTSCKRILVECWCALWLQLEDPETAPSMLIQACSDCHLSRAGKLTTDMMRGVWHCSLQSVVDCVGLGLLLKPHAFAAANLQGARPMAETDRHLRKC